MPQENVFVEQSGYSSVLSLERLISRKAAGIFSLAFGLLSLGFLFLTALFLPDRGVAENFLGGAEIFLGLFLSSLLLRLFIAYQESDHELTPIEIKTAWDSGNFGRALSFQAAQIVAESSRGDVLFLADFFTSLLRHEKFVWVLKRLNVSEESFGEFSRSFRPDQGLPLAEILRNAMQKAVAANHLHIRYGDIVVAVFESEPSLRDYFLKFEITEDDLKQAVYWQRRHDEQREAAGKFWHRERLLDTSGIGKHWAGGYTLNLDRVATDITAQTRLEKFPRHLFGRQVEVQTLSRMLLQGGDAVLVGPPGVGRHTVLRAFAYLVNTGQVSRSLAYKRILQIDTGSIIAGTTSVNDIVAKIETLFGEAYRAGNVILVINDFDAMFDSTPEAGRVNATEALLPYLKSALQVIGITTPAGYAGTIGKNPQLRELMGKVEVAEPDNERMLLILQDAVREYERGGIFFTLAAIKEIISLADKLIQDLPNPEKSLEILKDAAYYVAMETADKVVQKSHVQKVVSARTKVPVEKVEGEEKEKLINLESILHERIIGQDEAIQEIAGALRRGRSGVRSEKKPIGSFLFLGPTGVGKTETTKALASVMFGDEKNIVRLDMSEFQEIHGINRLIGDADTKTSGILTEAVIAKPFAVILLDEIEKAHPKILDLFLQVLDEGRLTDALGRTVSFINTMIIATSNAGAETIREMVKSGKNPAAAREELLDTILRQNLFRPEFLNRFDGIVIFRPLSEEELVQVAYLLLQELNSRLAAKNIQINITPELAQAVVKGGFSAEFGARPLRRYIQEKIENYVANGVIAGEYQPGTVIEIPPEKLYN